jgi:hypothetical protein
MEELGFMGITNFFACGSAGQNNQCHIDLQKYCWLIDCFSS